MTAESGGVMTHTFHVLTGAPGTGKTSILERLRDHVAVVPEPARRVLAVWRADGNPRPAQMDPELMVRRITEMSIADHAAAAGTVVFDRGPIDCVVYARYLGTDESLPLSAARSLRFDGLTFLTTPWREIYTTDEERTMSFDDVTRFHDVLVATYEDFGCELVEVPRGSIEDRAAFILDRIG